MIFAANFKSNHSRASFKEYAGILGDFWSECDKKDDEIIIFPPFSAFCGCALKGKKISLGEQNFYPADSGAFTGEICADMLSEFDINSVLVGHSERRGLGEDDEFVRAKFEFAKAKLWRVVLCVGEDDIVHMNGNTCEFLESQLEGIDLAYEKLIIAYEPIWAIGIGKSAKPEIIAEILEFLSLKTKAPLLYGGSVNAGNIAMITQIPHCAGVLVGSASWQVQSFIELIKASKA